MNRLINVFVCLFRIHYLAWWIIHLKKLRVQLKVEVRWGLVAVREDCLGKGKVRCCVNCVIVLHLSGLKLSVGSLFVLFVRLYWLVSLRMWEMINIVLWDYWLPLLFFISFPPLNKQEVHIFSPLSIPVWWGKTQLLTWVLKQKVPYDDCSQLLFFQLHLSTVITTGFALVVNYPT